MTGFPATPPDTGTGYGSPHPERAFVLPDAVRDEFINAVGRDNALVTDEERDEYRDPYWLPEDRSYDSSLALFPTSTEQVQEIVRIANRHEVPVWASSQGRNNGYGGPSARVKGSVLISFRKMNRVLEVNTELAYAVVEPGVRWFDLYDVLHEQGDELLVSIPDIGWGSVIGNSLDNGITFMPYGTVGNSGYRRPRSGRDRSGSESGTRARSGLGHIQRHRGRRTLENVG